MCIGRIRPPIYLGLGLCAILNIHVAPVSADAFEELDTIVVTAEAMVTTPFKTVDDLQFELDAVPGGANLITLSDSQSAGTLSDVLGNQPGIIVQEFFGGLDQPRINIRGSGLQANPVSRGVLIRENYLPLNEADGSFILGALDLKNTEAVTVHRGANSRVAGAMSLGGDINFISQLASLDRDRVRVEVGSFSHQSMDFDHQRQSDTGYYRLGFSESSADGFRHHSESQRDIYRFSLGLAFAENVFSETHFRLTDFRFEMPFVLPADRAEQAPESVMGDGLGLLDIGLNVYARDPHRAVRQHRLSNRLLVSGEAQEHMLGVYHQKTDDAFVDPISHIETDSTLLGLHYTFDHYPTPYIHYQLGLDWSQSDMPREYFGNHPIKGDRWGHYASFNLTAENISAALSMDITLMPTLTLNGQIQGTKAQRRGMESIEQEVLNESWTRWVPKLGLIYQPAMSQMRLFINASRAVEFPTFWELTGSSINPLLTYLSDAEFLNLEPQQAFSLEIGGDYHLGLHELNLSIYRSDIEHELISTASQFGVIATTSNYQGQTIHQGIELGINGLFNLDNHQLIYSAAWNHSDFYFAEGQFAGNKIAGVPENIISGEMLFQYSGFSIGPSFTWVPDNNPVDNENTLDQGNYRVFGMKIRYELNPFIRGFVVFNNITDERYNSSYVVRASANSDLPTFLPGNGFGFQAGMSIQLDH